MTGVKKIASHEKNTAAEVQPVQEPLHTDAGSINMERSHTSAAAVGQAGQEVNAVGAAIMRMPEQSLIQRSCAACEEEEKVQRKSLAPFAAPGIQVKTNSGGTAASDAVTAGISASRGNGSSLDSSTRSFMESRFGADFSGVTIHTGSEAVQLSRQLNAQAFTVGSDIYFNEGKYNPGTDSGKHLLAHELTHTIQQGGDNHAPAVMKKPLVTERLKQLRTLLSDGSETEAITLMGQLDDNEKRAVFESREYKELAISAFGNRTMYLAMQRMNFNLYKSLEWMFDEGTSWDYVRSLISQIKEGRDDVVADGWMKKQFADTCNNKEMADAVDILGGTLLQKLEWMYEEGASWKLVKAKITATASPDERKELYGSGIMKLFFVDICNDEEMAEAVGLLGGTLLQQLQWMHAEGASWKLVKKRIAATADKNEKTNLYGNAEMKGFFTSICNDGEMTEAVTMLGGSLNSKLQWLAAEEVAARHYFDVIRGTPDAEITGVTAATRKLIENDLSKDDYGRVIQMLDGGLLKWGTDEIKYKEKLSEPKTGGGREIKTYDGDTTYDIEYTRTNLKIIVRVKLTGEPVTQARKNIWIAGIQNRWKDKFHLEGPRRLPMIFDVIFTDDNPHHKLKIKNQPGMREDAGNWELNTTGDTAAHEFGHWVGNQDEYWRTAADFQAIVGRAPTAAEQAGAPDVFTASDLIMSSGQGDAQIRHFRNFLNWLNANRLPGEKPYTLVAGA